MVNFRATRRVLLGSAALLAGRPLALKASGGDTTPYQVATFSVRVTPPLGRPLLAGWIAPAKRIADPLEVRGCTLLGPDEPIVLAAIDWCELRNDAYDRWRDALAAAAGTRRERVLLACVHQHDAPYADLTAGRLLARHGLAGAMFDPQFHERSVQQTAAALRDSLEQRRAVTHIGIGQAKVQRVACNRRVELPGQPPRFNRGSFTRDLTVRNAPEGQIDPYLKTISFWDGSRPLVAISCYATHPMSYYGTGEVSADFPGLARRLRQRQLPDVFQIYFSGCSGDVTAAKYNDGTFASRQALAERLSAAMAEAWSGTKRHRLQRVRFNCVPLKLPVERSGALEPGRLERILADPKASYKARSQAALGLSWQRRCRAGQPIDLPVVDFGPARFLILPAESFVAYQLAAQRMRPDLFLITAGYGECAPGYIPTEQARREGFVREHGYCWVAAGAERAILSAVAQALGLNRRRP